MIKIPGVDSPSHIVDNGTSEKGEAGGDGVKSKGGNGDDSGDVGGDGDVSSELSPLPIEPW